MNYKSKDSLVKYITNLREQKNVCLSFVIVDNNSNDGSFELFERLYSNDDAVTLVFSKSNDGYAIGNNKGIEKVKSEEFDFLLISNNDIEVKDNMLLFNLVSKINSLQDVAFISPMMKVNDIVSRASAWKEPSFLIDLLLFSRVSSRLINNYLYYDLNTADEVVPVHCLPGSFFLSKKEVIYNIGLFDEGTFLYSEERILAKKVKEANLQNYLYKKGEFYHESSKSISVAFDVLARGKMLYDTRLYYHKKYNKIGSFKSTLFFLAYKYWILETKLFHKLKESFRKYF